MVADLVGQLAAAPIFGLVERAVEALNDLLDLRMEIGNLLVGGLRRDDVDELVLSVRAHVSPYGLSGPPSLGSAELRRDRLRLS